MTIEKIDVYPSGNSVVPEFEFVIQYKMQKRYKIPLAINGIVLTDTGKKISTFSNSFYDYFPTIRLEAFGDFSLRNDTETFNAKFYVTANQKQLDFIEECRQSNAKKDVKFKIILTIDLLSSDTTIANTIVSNSETHKVEIGKGDIAFPLLIKANKSDYRSDPKLLASYGSESSFLSFEKTKCEISVTIKSSDWIHDFCPAFGIGKFLVYDFPIVDLENQLNNNLSERILKASESIKKMEKDFQSGEWNDLIQNSRSVIELFSKNTEDLKQLLVNEGYSIEAINSFIDKGLSGIFDLAGKFIHTMDKSKENLNPSINANKEDAMLIYSLSVNLVNMFSKKIKRQNTKN